MFETVSFEKIELKVWLAEKRGGGRREGKEKEGRREEEERKMEETEKGRIRRIMDPAWMTRNLCPARGLNGGKRPS